MKYTINNNLLESVVRLVQKHKPGTPKDMIKDHLLAENDDGFVHQLWLDNAGATQIADWFFDTADLGEVRPPDQLDDYDYDFGENDHYKEDWGDR